MERAKRTVAPSFTLPTEVAASRPSIIFEDLGGRVRFAAHVEEHDVASGAFAEPTIYASLTMPDEDGPLSYVGLSFAQFAMPVRATSDQPFAWDPADNVSSPPTVIPLLISSPTGRVCLLAPLDSWHEQSIAVVQDEAGVHGFRWGWHGDIDHLPAGSVITLGVYEGDSVTEVFERWGAEIGAAAAAARRPIDPVVTHLSYWTDNGAAYWYRTEPGLGIDDTLAAKLDELRELGVAVRSVELDSWFYAHEVSRQVSDVGYLDEVPPTGMLTWEPRTDVLPAGVSALADRLGRPPLVLHSRHISTESPYVQEGDWWLDQSAHPVDQGFFMRWMADAASWGATCVEQDWMVMNWFGVRQLRAEPGRAMAWQRGLDEAAAQHDLTLIWCMATPGDLMATVELDRVVAVRTCDDYRFAEDPARLWVWYLTVNRLAAALGLPVSKDCFFTGAEPGPSGIDGDLHVEVEALLSAFSGGVAGIGDRLGTTDPAIVDRLARPDGLLVQPDRPLALADVSFVDPGGAVSSGRPSDGSPTLTWSTTATGDWRYIVALHTAATVDAITDGFELGDRYVIYDWASETATVGSRCETTLDSRGWALFICCPVVDVDGMRTAVIGDPTRYATMGRARVFVDEAGEVTVYPADGERGVSIRRWTEVSGLYDEWIPSADLD